MNIKSIYFKSDFTVILASEAQWGGCPFRLNFYTASPSRSFVASFDGEHYENCRLLPDGRLEVGINQKDGDVQTLMGIGKLMCAPEFYLDNDAFRDHICNQFVKPFAPQFAPSGLYAEMDGRSVTLHNVVVNDILSGSAGEIKFSWMYYGSRTDGWTLKRNSDSLIMLGPSNQLMICEPSSFSFDDEIADLKLTMPESSSVGDCVGVYEASTGRSVLGERCEIVLSLDGASTIETIGTLPAFYQKGEKGDKGDQGEQGPKGEKGDKGDQGEQGPKGEKGDKGDRGESGSAGALEMAGILNLTEASCISALGAFRENELRFYFAGDSTGKYPSSETYVRVNDTVKTLNFMKMDDDFHVNVGDIIAVYGYKTLLGVIPVCKVLVMNDAKAGLTDGIMTKEDKQTLINSFNRANEAFNVASSRMKVFTEPVNAGNVTNEGLYTNMTVGRPSTAGEDGDTSYTLVCGVGAMTQLCVGNVSGKVWARANKGEWTLLYTDVNQIMVDGVPLPQFIFQGIDGKVDKYTTDEFTVDEYEIGGIDKNGNISEKYNTVKTSSFIPIDNAYSEYVVAAFKSSSSNYYSVALYDKDKNFVRGMYEEAGVPGQQNVEFSFSPDEGIRYFRFMRALNDSMFYRCTFAISLKMKELANAMPSKVNDAPSDGKQYARENGAWVAVTGTQGPVGPQGPQGPVGPQGPKGDKGDSVTMFPAVTIFGQPTIQETQMSEFSAANYAQFPFLVDFAGRHWQLDFAITTGADLSQQHNVFDSAFGLALAISGGKFVLAMSSNGTSWNLGATSGTHGLLANYTYYIRITWDGSQYKLSASVNKVVWIDDIVVNSSESLASKQIIIGKSLDNAHIFNGSINFAEARLTIANVIVWEGMEEVGTATRMALDMSNIDEAGKQRVNEISLEGEVGQKLSGLWDNTEILQIKTSDSDYHTLPTLCGQPMTLFGAGTPQEAIVPTNWRQYDPATGEGYQWNGMPSALGQVYINTSASTNGRYTAVENGFGNLKWVNF